MKKALIILVAVSFSLGLLIVNVNPVRAFATSTHLPYSGSYKVTNLHTGGNSLGNKGVDFGMATNTNLYASGEGTISTVSYGYNGGWGNYLILSHPENYKSRYAHLNSILKSPGTYAYAGVNIAKSGNTGQSTGPHLHFQQYRYGTSDSNSVQIAPISNYTGFAVNQWYNNSGYNTNWTQWNFNTTPEGWWLQRAEDLGVNQGLGGKWIQNPASDPGMRSPRFQGINATTYKKIKVRFSAYGGGNDTGTIYFSKTLDPMNFSGNSVTFGPVVKDGVQREYTVNMYSGSSNWRGTIYGLRIDPIVNGNSGSGDKIYVDYVKLTQ